MPQAIIPHKLNICIKNNSAHSIHAVRIDGSMPLFSVTAGSSRTVNLRYSSINEGRGVIRKQDQRNVNTILIDLHFLDEDGNQWQTSFSALGQCRDGISIVLEQGMLVGIGQ